MLFLTNSVRSDLIMQAAPILRWKKGNYLFYSSEARTASLRRLLDIQRTFVSHTWFWVLFCLCWTPSQKGYSCVHRVGAQKALVELTLTWLSWMLVVGEILEVAWVSSSTLRGGGELQGTTDEEKCTPCEGYTFQRREIQKFKVYFIREKFYIQ